MKQVFRDFFGQSTTPGILLCLSAVLAMFAENSDLSDFYAAFKALPVVVQFGTFEINKPLLLWINDGVMAVFFLLVGLEIKREMIKGHLSKPSQVVLPTLAALGGLSVPALIYASLNWNTGGTIDGWAIPSATDIAFALGVMLLMGDRVPPALKVCLVAIAIIDDLAAIVIIALFYTTELSLIALLLAFVGLAMVVVMNIRGVTRLTPYVLVGIFIWACVLKSGVHATLAGVALGLVIPLRAKNEQGKAPLKVMEHNLHPWVSFLVLPVFAFANAGVSLAGLSVDTFAQPITLGIMLGLFIGKQTGVMLITALATTLRLCKLPEGTNWTQYYGMALLTGIGFTMSLFVGTLAFSDIEHASAVRLGVLSGSLLSTFAGVAVLWWATRKDKV